MDQITGFLDIRIDNISVKWWIFLWVLFFVSLWWANKKMDEAWEKAIDYEDKLEKEEAA